MYVDGNVDYNIETGEISFKLNGQSLEQLYSDLNKE